MFKNSFSFDGRIRRTEFGISSIIYVIVQTIITGIVNSADRDSGAGIIVILYIPLLWFYWAQGAKRCHDLGKSGWWQIIPLYILWLLFQEGKAGSNQFGENPKGIQVVGTQSVQIIQNTGTPGGYQGGYSGGHNSPNTNYSSTENPARTDGYKDGDLYK